MKQLTHSLTQARALSKIKSFNIKGLVFMPWLELKDLKLKDLLTV